MSFLPIKNIYYSKFEQIPNITSNIINDIIKSIENFTIQYSNEEDIIIEDYINTIFESKIKDILKLLLNNSDIINNIINKSLDPLEIAFIKVEKLYPKKYEKIIKKINLMSETMRKGTTAFTCTKCKGNNCNVTQMQTRACDEPPTTIVECNICKHVFRCG